MAALTFKVGGDTSGLKRALGGAKGMLTSLANSAKGLALGGLATGAAGATAAMVGMKKALDLGGRLSDVAANTGLLAGEALVLEQALREAGISGEKLQPTIQKMQKSIVEAGDGLKTPMRAFEALGLSLGELQGMKPGEQFTAIQNALAGISDPAERSARAMQIFGRSGGELGALFSNPDALRNASDAVGSQAEILTKGAASFDRSADILGNIGAKLSGFFVGMASWVNPVLLPVLEEMNKLDFAQFGAAAGETISKFAVAFQEGALPGLFKDGLMVAAGSMINAVARGFKMIIAGLMAALSQIPAFFAAGMKLVTDATFWTKAGNTLAGGIRMASVKATQALPDWMVPGEKLSAQGEAKVLEALEGFTMGNATAAMDQVMSEALPMIEATRKAMQDALMSAAESGDVFDVSGNRERMKDTWEMLGEIVKRRKENAELIEAEQKAENTLPTLEEEKPNLMDAFEKTIRPAVSSLGRIGGAAIRGTRADQMDLERNRYLKKISENTAGPTVAVYA